MGRNKIKINVKERKSFLTKKKGVNTSPGKAHEPGRIDDRIISKSSPHYYNYIVAVVLLGFGVYEAVIYFDHKVVPSPDFPAFVRVGHQILLGDIPWGDKRAPVVGLLQAIISYFVGGQHPDLTAGRLLNALIFPFTGLLIWLTCRKTIGCFPAFIISILSLINPWTIQYFQEPIAEIPLFFFTVLTFFFLSRRSRWAYLFASIAMMVRYEGAALIVVTFLLNQIEAKTRKDRLMAFVWSFLAAIPLLAWMAGLIVNWHSTGTTHYLKEMGVTAEGKNVPLEYLALIWRASIQPLFIFPPSWPPRLTVWFSFFTKIMLTIGSFWAFGYGVWKRQWEILAYAIFLVLYTIIHIAYSVIDPRYCIMTNWIQLLLLFYGLEKFYLLIQNSNKISSAAIVGLQVILLFFLCIWIFYLYPCLEKLSPISPVSRHIPHVAIASVLVILVAKILPMQNMRGIFSLVVGSVLLCLMILSNQFTLASTVQDGKLDIEFKLLADWYVAHAEPDTKMVTSMPHIVRIFAPKQSSAFVAKQTIIGKNADDFINQCYTQNITYVAWDSRIGFNVGGRYYKLWGIQDINMLNRPQNVGPYEFVTQIVATPKRYINIFRLKK